MPLSEHLEPYFDGEMIALHAAFDDSAQFRDLAISISGVSPEGLPSWTSSSDAQDKQRPRATPPATKPASTTTTGTRPPPDGALPEKTTPRTVSKQPPPNSPASSTSPPSTRREKHNALENRRRGVKRQIFDELKFLLEGPTQQIPILRKCLRVVKLAKTK
ncbi:BHLH domain-containing protein [Plasmodiophora brassicae]|uniref:BHLH domain-containing protein n=1 Tax=Plasmodiophora brassicae TaxID=37360 RepID=A0A3P3XZ63_PLABS|nr:unnamed protein product [Plasmodiophora brassicae]